LTLFQVSPERMRLLAVAKPEYLDGVYTEIVRQYGGAEEFLRRGCGVDAEVLGRLKERFLGA
jgi:protein-tyrosine phosphatase